MNIIFSDIWRLFPFRAISLLVIASIASLTEGVVLMLLLPLLNMLSGETQSSGVVSYILHLFDTVGIPYTATACAAIVVFAAVVQYSFVLLQASIGAYLQSVYVFSIRRELFDSVLFARWDYLVGIRSADYLNGLIADAAHASLALTYLINFFSALITAGVYMVIAFGLSSLLSVVLLSTFAVVGAATYFAGKRSSIIGRETCEVENRSARWLAEVLGSLKSYKASAWESFARRAYGDLNVKLSNLIAVALRSPQLVRVAMEFGALVGLILMVYVGASELQIAFPVLLVLLGAFLRTYPRLIASQQAFQLLSLHLQSVRRVHRLVNEASAHRESIGGVEFNPTTHGVDINCSDLEVLAGGRAVLSGVSLSVHPGEYLAIVGPSGSGKTTLVDCLLGLRQFERGSITINGVSLLDIDLHSWRSRVAYVSQDPPIFNATITENIAWGRSGLDKEEIIKAAKAAHAHDFICSFEDGYDTVVGDRGGKLSGGQRQRIAIARALLAESVLLVFDEATSALDSSSEQEVVNTLDDLKGTLNIIVIAHRLASVRRADRIIVMDEGGVIESGDWVGLIGLRGLFAKLASHQGHG